MAAVGQTIKEVANLRAEVERQKNKIQRMNSVRKNKGNGKNFIGQRNRQVKTKRRNINILQNTNRLGIHLSQNTGAWLDTMINPFGVKIPSRIPDDFVGQSLCFKDFNIMSTHNFYGATTLLGGTSGLEDPAPGSSSGICFFIIPGGSAANIYYDLNFSNLPPATPADNATYYHLVCCMINSDGTLCPATDAAYSYPALVPTNEMGIFSGETPLAVELRLVGAGFRVWPLVPYQTSSDTLTIASINGGKMTIGNLFNNYFTDNNPQSIYSGLESSNGYQTFDNLQGCTARINTMQGYISKMKTVGTWTSDQFDLDDVEIPLVVVTFNQTVTGVLNTDNQITMFQTLPIKIETVYHFEGVAKQPTPLQQLPSPIEANYQQIRQSVLADRDQIFPIITEGHSFKPFLQKLNQFANHTVKFLSGAANLATRVGRGIRVVQNL